MIKTVSWELIEQFINSHNWFPLYKKSKDNVDNGLSTIIKEYNIDIPYQNFPSEKFGGRVFLSGLYNLLFCLFLIIWGITVVFCFFSMIWLIAWIIITFVIGILLYNYKKKIKIQNKDNGIFFGRQMFFPNNNRSRKDFEKILKQICESMNVDYYSTVENFETASANGNVYMGWGSVGAVGVGALATLISSSNAKDKARAYNFKTSILKLLISYNKIADYFNSIHYPEEYQNSQMVQL
jgi:hypothetical protein